MQQIKSILIGWIGTSRLCLSFNKVSWTKPGPCCSLWFYDFSLFRACSSIDVQRCSSKPQQMCAPVNEVKCSDVPEDVCETQIQVTANSSNFLYYLLDKTLLCSIIPIPAYPGGAQPVLFRRTTNLYTYKMKSKNQSKLIIVSKCMKTVCLT